MIASNYYIIAGLSVLCLIVGLVHLEQNYSFPKEATKWLKYLAYIIIFNIVLDTMFYTFEKQPYVEKDVLYAVKFFEFSVNLFIPLAVIEVFRAQYSYRNNHQKANKISRIALVICLVNIAVLLVDLKEHFLYTINDNNTYCRGSLIIIEIVFLVVSIGLSLLVISDFSSSIQGASRRTIICFCIIVGSGYAVRLVNAETNFDWLCVTIAYLLLLIYDYSVTLKIDPLTQLYNRNVYSHFIERIDFPTIIFTMDVNAFKSINDTYGHPCGDDALKAVSDCILKVYSKSCYCFRQGGDEFCAIMKPDSFRALTKDVNNHDIRKVAESFTSHLNDCVKDYNDKHDGELHLEHGVSQGYGIFIPISESFDENKKHASINEVIILADKRLYKEKRAFRKSLKEAKNPINLPAQSPAEEESH